MRELRLIAEHKPRYNRRSRFPEKVHFVKLTREAWPRLSLVKQVLDDDADYLGPFSSRKVAEKCLAALHETFPVRQCSGRLPRRPSRSACVLAEMGRCLSPCDGSVDEATYAAVVRQSCATPCSIVPTRSSRRSTPGWQASPTSTASRRRASTATGWRRSSGPLAHPAAVCADPVPRDRRRPSRGRRPMGGARRAPRPARRRRRHPVRRRRPRSTSPSCGPPPRRFWPGPGPSPPRPPRSPRRSCAGSSRRASAWSTSTASGPARSPAPAGHLAVHDAVEQSRRVLVPFDERRELTTLARPAR